MTKKEYLKPVMTVVRIQQQGIICASTKGMNTSLQSEEVSSAWSRSNSDWDDEEE